MPGSPIMLAKDFMRAGIVVRIQAHMHRDLHAARLGRIKHQARQLIGEHRL